MTQKTETGSPAKKGDEPLTQSKPHAQLHNEGKDSQGKTAGTPAVDDKKAASTDTKAAKDAERPQARREGINDDDRDAPSSEPPRKKAAPAGDQSYLPNLAPGDPVKVKETWKQGGGWHNALVTAVQGTQVHVSLQDDDNVAIPRSHHVVERHSSYVKER